MRLTVLRLTEGFHTACGALGLFIIASPLLALLAGVGWLVHAAFVAVFGPHDGQLYFILAVVILGRALVDEWRNPSSRPRRRGGSRGKARAS